MWKKSERPYIFMVKIDDLTCICAKVIALNEQELKKLVIHLRGFVRRNHKGIVTLSAQCKWVTDTKAGKPTLLTA